MLTAHGAILVGVIATVIFEVAPPSQGNAPIVAALEIPRLVALGTVLWARLVGVVAAVVLAIAKEPRRNAPIVGYGRALLPAGGAVAVP